MAKTFRLILKDSENRAVSLDFDTLVAWTNLRTKELKAVYNVLIANELLKAKKLVEEAKKRFVIVDKKTKKRLSPKIEFLNESAAKNYFFSHSLEEKKLEIKEIKKE